MTEEQIQTEIKKINGMSQMELCRMYRYCPPGHPYFTVTRLSDAFQARFAEAGGFTPEISKALGW